MPDETRIEIEPNGPYIVHGNVPLKTMAPVHTFNGEPVDWHELSEEHPGEVAYRLCRCGQSQSKPFCDDSHLTADFDGTETASRVPYMERAKLVEHGAEVLADDKSLCVDAGFCGTRTRKAWQMFVNVEEPAAREEMRQMVFRC